MKQSAHVFLIIVSSVFVMACSEYHNHEGDALFSVWKMPFSCETISSARLIKVEGEDVSANSQKSLPHTGNVESLGTLCNAAAERTFFVTCDRLDQFGLLNPRSTLELVFSRGKSRIEMYFGRKTPDGFGQYIFLNEIEDYAILNSRLVNNGNPCRKKDYAADEGISVLVIPAYHLEQLISLGAKKSVFSYPPSIAGINLTLLVFSISSKNQSWSIEESIAIANPLLSASLMPGKSLSIWFKRSWRSSALTS